VGLAMRGVRSAERSVKIGQGRWISDLLRAVVCQWWNRLLAYQVFEAEMWVETELVEEVKA
jgi:hypothetical protein